MIRLALLLLTLALPASAQDRAAIEQQFRSWLEQDIWPAASAQGVSRATFDRSFSGVRLNWDLPDLVPPGSKATTPKRQTQSEFGAPGRYFRGVSGDAAIGRDLARRHATTLARIEKQTGVPGRILLGIWGRESAYGRAKIPHNVFAVLGTKGFMATRAPYFREELIAALQIAEAGHASGPLRSSWAGALGQPQFMPSSFLQYAADGDGDGRADIWGSVPDTLASIANYLARHGWVPGRDWGFEVTVPASVSCALEGPDQGRPISEWEAMGITRVSNRPFPDHERSGEGFLMMPAGRNGPAFVVTPNFYVLKDYNMSDLYALYVGHVGDRIQYGVGNFSAPWGAVGKMYRSDIAAMQRSLEGMGHDVGGADGLPGFKTRRSIGRWQEATGRAATCFPEPSMKAQLVR
ncbi:lytic transglycosylase domain-containing protein [Roseovarius atlanticus]|uniref:lytic murein transglycosylase n=1 Tax=Roseovarius atlanticus TaxID=1641875 RepID=UPI001C980D19|nr:lytic murein transglycosylase [Roseovarius atlanticus]MBY5989240.1 lytic murein transglycosylase [Roseovarius atlanticus]MBY6124632.1 lytic murein transglycosylase [Roseovarius atlanticus]MBY6149127.1 lytic murein transglycosylase [Roseovarius atlanticus]